MKYGWAAKVRDEWLVASGDLFIIAQAIQRNGLDKDALNQCADELARGVKLLHKLAKESAMD